MTQNGMKRHEKRNHIFFTRSGFAAYRIACRSSDGNSGDGHGCAVMDELKKAMQDIDLAFDLFRSIDGVRFLDFTADNSGLREFHVYRGIEKLAEIFGAEIGIMTNCNFHIEKFFHVDGFRFFEFPKDDDE